MGMQDNRRIAFFHSGWLVESQTANAVTMFADAGYDVELFTYNRPPSQEYVNFEELKKRTKAEIYQLWRFDETSSKPVTPKPTNGTPTLKQRFKSFLRTRFPSVASSHLFLRNAYQSYCLRRGLAETLLAPGLVDRALKLMAGKQYRCLIGVEKKGLIWAGLVARKLQVPFFYHSLELYTDEDYCCRMLGEEPHAFRRLRLGERLHHRRAYATIIQDADRARVLFNDNGLDRSKANVFYVPVSVLGDPYKQRSRYLQESLRIPCGRKIILYFGNIWERRYVCELVKVAQTFPDDWVLVMHGPTSGSTTEKIKELDEGRKVILSLELVPSEQIQEVIASADVGLLFYSGQSHNERLTAFSSEKMALYMQCGVPFVAFDYPGFRRLAEDEGCGLVISRLEELPDAIGEILSSDDKFRQRAQRAFCKHYSFAKSFAKVVEAIALL